MKFIKTLLSLIIAISAAGQTGILPPTTATGTNTYTAPNPSGFTVTSYTDGNRYHVRFTNANTSTSVTLSIGAGPARSVYNSNGGVINLGEIRPGDEKILVFSSTSNGFRVLGGAGAVADEINDGITTIAPSQNAVYDALALKLTHNRNYIAKTTSYTLGSTDLAAYKSSNNNLTYVFTPSGSVTLTLPSDADVAYDIGTFMLVRRSGTTGFLNFAAGSGATVKAMSGFLVDNGEDAIMAIEKTAANTWLINNAGVNAYEKKPTADINSTSTTLVNITGLSWALDANSTYRITGTLHNGTTGGGTGAAIALSYTGTVSSVFVNGFARGSSNTAPTYPSITAIGSASTPFNQNASATNTGNGFWDGDIQTTTAGTLQVQFSLGSSSGQTATAYVVGTNFSVRKIQ
jgi:hypothetical protein